MRVFIAGGRGRVGTKAAEALERDGADVVLGDIADGIDVISGAGLDRALDGVDTILNVLNTSQFEREAATRFFEFSTRTLTEAGRRAGVARHVLLSIVGVGQRDASDVGYYLGKVAQEDAVRAAGIPSVIVRSTQFQGYVPVLADQYTVAGRVLATRSLIQPVDLDEVAALLAEAATGRLDVDEIEIAGPDRFYLDDLLRATLAASGDRREVVTVPADGRPDALVPRGVYRAGRVHYPIGGIPRVDAA